MKQKRVKPVAPDPSVRQVRQRQNPLRGRAREKNPVDKSTADERLAAWLERGVTPGIRTWAAARGFEPYLDLHFEHFRDYLAQKEARHYVDHDAAFRSCVRADWGGVRKQAQIAAAHGRGIDLEGWWKAADGVKAKGMALGLNWERDRYIALVAKLHGQRRGNEGWREPSAEELASWAWRYYETEVLDAVTEREGWGPWVDSTHRSSEYAAVCRRRAARGAAVPGTLH